MDGFTKKRLEFDRIVDCVSQLCLSDMGRDELSAASPLLCREALVRELERVMELKNFLLEGQPLPFAALPDTRSLVRKLETLDTYLEPEELLDIHDLLQASVSLRTFMYRNRTLYPAVNEFTVQLWMEKSLQFEIKGIVDEEARVRDTASDGLLMIRRELREGRQTLRRKMERLLRRCQENNWLMEDTVAMKNGRLVLGLRVEYKYKLPGYIQDYSQSGQTVFVEPAETLELNNRLQDLELDERREVERILREMSSRIREELDNVQHNQSVMAVFDSIYARARFAVDTAGVMPALDDGRRLKIVRGFHPWLLVTHRARGEEVFPLDMELDGDEQVLVISGPNAGGKSVGMKTVGLLCCMLHHGYLVPCSESSVFPLFDDIFIGIGDEQSIENDLSTFSSHLEQIRLILASASARSLVLIDELCSGTDVEEGSAIARAVIEELLLKECKAVITTHLGELKVYAHERKGAVNGAMEFDRATLSPSFRFLKGLPGNSFAFAMMQRLGFDRGVIDRANGFLCRKSAGFELMLDDLKTVLEENRLLRERLGEERRQLECREQQIALSEAALLRRQKEMKATVSREVQKEVEHARKMIRDIVREAKASPDAHAVESARQKLHARKKQAEAEEVKAVASLEEHVDEDRTIRPGDMVRVMTTNTTGEVVSVDRDDVVVQCGTFRLSTSLKHVEKTSKTQAKKLEREVRGSKAKGWSSRSSVLESTRLDLRGLNGDEAIVEIDRFIDKLRLNRVSSAVIIHGKGTGALRMRIADFLKTHNHVEHFRLGELSEGGSGVTVIDVL
ncbi:MAG: endonuclease MutS2 [Prosthecochloris sp.]|uniref:Endonuclease MutS2 n=1 Tax=Prosthecochloris aestuarii (strain DSM 271 / SK 413) TaxID=290512 RepID=B4S3G8_PROA2|nr:MULTISPECIES: endonuclease MutS2 [Prosthecochloris]ACF46707.1 Smr protein/MutS2 [Prosthecochloris aestuarii DSM 271]MCW8798498.1 endonuclease MutS2 [Prosthecochloris sp.]